MKRTTRRLFVLCCINDLVGLMAGACLVSHPPLLWLAMGMLVVMIGIASVQ